MKKIKFLALLLVVSFSLLVNDIYAQGGPPPWAPAKGYRAKARYTYFPSLNFYFDTKIGIYFFLDAGIWVQKTSLPVKYKNYNWGNYKYEEFDWSNNQPWEKHNGKSNGKSKGNNGNGKGNGKKS
ncbi:MAG: hypothetical protein ACRC2O_06980 [Chitinophagaceae bacterium]